MGFWGAVEGAVVNGIAGAAGLAEVVPAVGLAANAVAAGVHGIDMVGHEIAGGYDSLTGDEKGADEQRRIAAAQGVDTIAAAIPYVGVGAAATDLVAAGGDAAAAGARAAGQSDEQAPLMPTIGDTVINAIQPEEDKGQMSYGDLWHGLTR